MRILRSVRPLLFLLVMLPIAAASYGQIGIRVTFAPPPLPVYDQPECPGDGYIWTPGYWGWDADFDDYYWIPGTWVEAPEVGYLWTPPYWGWADNAFVFYDGYWGPQVGFYGGISYGFGYFGEGYVGGRWDNGHFFYNRAVTNVNVTIVHNVYENRVQNTVVNRVSYNGGNGGINARPTREQETIAHERHMGPVAAQTQHMRAAQENRDLRASVNRGKPAIAATPKPADFSGRGVVHARQAGGEYKPHPASARGGNEAGRPANEPARNEGNNRPENTNARPESNQRTGNPVHARDLPAPERPTPPNTGDSKRDQKYAQQQEKMMAKQQQEREKLEKKQEQEHAKAEKSQANQARQQQMEQRHQQQTQQLQQRQSQQMQRMQQRQAPPSHPAASHQESHPPKH